MLKTTTALAAIMAAAFGVSSAHAADFSVPDVVPTYVAPQGYTWNGLYVGGSIGYAWQHRDNSLSCDEAPADDFFLSEDLEDGLVALFPEYVGDVSPVSPDLSCLVTDLNDPTEDRFHIFNLDDDDGDDSGFMAGLFVGVNRQYGGFVVGTELEGVWLDSSTSSNTFMWEHNDNANQQIELGDALAGGFAAFQTTGPDWIAHGTIKGGWLMGSMQQTLLYVKGGFAVGAPQESSFASLESFDGDDNQGGPGEVVAVGPPGSKQSGYGFGGTLGVGVEHKFSQHFSLGLEYQATFLDYRGSHDATFIVEDLGADETRLTTIKSAFEDVAVHAIKAKATWHFN